MTGEKLDAINEALGLFASGDLLTNETVIAFCTSLVKIADDLADQSLEQQEFADRTIANTVRVLAQRRQ